MVVFRFYFFFYLFVCLWNRLIHSFETIIYGQQQQQQRRQQWKLEWMVFKWIFYWSISIYYDFGLCFEWIDNKSNHWREKKEKKPRLKSNGNKTPDTHTQPDKSGYRIIWHFLTYIHTLPINKNIRGVNNTHTYAFELAISIGNESDLFQEREKEKQKKTHIVYPGTVNLIDFSLSFWHIHNDEKTN